MSSVVETSEFKIVERPARVLGMNPKRFILWLFIVTIVMMFASLTSAYIVRKAEGDWLEFELPSVFWYTSLILIISSITMHWSYLSSKKDQLANMKIGLIITAILGSAFLIGQWYAWIELVKIDVYFVGNPSGSFLYVLTGLHGFHIITALVFLGIVVYLAFRSKISSRQSLWIELCTTFWHFLDLLWLYLFGFLLLNQ
jgi:cytochrome c oxidase subunit 3